MPVADREKIDGYTTAFCNLLDQIAEQNSDHDFKKTPIYTLQEFKKDVLEHFKELLKMSKRYLAAYEIFNYLLNRKYKKKSDLNKQICIVDFMVYFSKIDSRIYSNLPNEVLKDTPKQDKFVALREVIKDGTRMNYRFDAELFEDPERRHSKRDLKQAKPVSLEQLTSAIYGRRGLKSRSKLLASLVGPEKRKDSTEEEEEQEQEPEPLPSRRSAKRQKVATIESENEFSNESEGDDYVPEKAKSKPKVTKLKVKKPKAAKVKEIPTKLTKAKLTKAKVDKPKKKTKEKKQKKETKEMKQTKEKKTIKKVNTPVIKRQRKKSYEPSLEFLFPGAHLNKHPVLVTEGSFERTYSPPRYSIFETYDEESDLELRKNLDQFIYDFSAHVSKSFNDTALNDNLYLHQLEYEFIMSHLGQLHAVRLPELRFQLRDKSDKSDKVHTKQYDVKNIEKLIVFETEEQYKTAFGKLLPDDKIKERIEFLNTVVTDGSSIYIFKDLESLMKEPIEEAVVQSTHTEPETNQDHDEIVELEVEETKPDFNPSQSNMSLTGEVDQGDATTSIDNPRTVVAWGKDVAKILSLQEYLGILINMIFPDFKISSKKDIKEFNPKVLKNLSLKYVNFLTYQFDIFYRNLEVFLRQYKYFKFTSLLWAIELRSLRSKKLDSLARTKPKNAQKVAVNGERETVVNLDNEPTTAATSSVDVAISPARTIASVQSTIPPA
ncbi:hypothetical protein CANARDRAFT_28548 [[Candida] arabinofermentans NRRL YB-2248]|uniref:Uncharacterized protein n=1 Tax=[Candida] arabinofermentans NRRL YB-2248 TaxID=983967 RepID=A0A1E4T0K5_9ASCO|nr:hypothetical protein CANARDRAFT_28548 [[Candida] arabinofermentans NRRL YB-2248]